MFRSRTDNSNEASEQRAQVASGAGTRPKGVVGQVKVMEKALWGIYDRQTGRPYVTAGFTKEEAEKELSILLAPYSEDNPWRKRLFIAGYQRGR